MDMVLQDVFTEGDTVSEDQVRESAVIERLLGQSYLFDDPAAYEAGVRDAVDVLASPRRPELRSEMGPDEQEHRVEAMKAHPSAGVARRLTAADEEHRDPIPGGIRQGSAA